MPPPTVLAAPISLFIRENNGIFGDLTHEFVNVTDRITNKTADWTGYWAKNYQGNIPILSGRALR
jgi:hypothetical protein